MPQLIEQKTIRDVDPADIPKGAVHEHERIHLLIAIAVSESGFVEGRRLQTREEQGVDIIVRVLVTSLVELSYVNVVELHVLETFKGTFQNLHHRV